MRIRIPKLNSGKSWTIFSIVIFVVTYIFVYTLHFPRSLLYIGDIINIFVFINAIRFRKKHHLGILKTEAVMILFLVCGIISSVINLENIGLVIWGLRNNSRMFIVYSNCVTFLKKEDFKSVINFIEIIFWVSLPLCVIERFLISYPIGTIIGDMIGGIFWNYSGCNMPLNLILCVIVLKKSIEYFQSKTNTSMFICTISAALFMSSLAELKVFILELVIIFIGIFLTFRVGWKRTLKMLVGVIFLAVLISFFVTIFIQLNDNGHDYASNFTISGFLDYASRDTGYDGVGDLNRMNGITQIIKGIFSKNYIKILFGVGLGNAEYTNFFVSDFYRNFGLLHYQYFHHIWMFIEVGAIGIVIYIYIYIRMFFKAKNKMMSSGEVCYIRTLIIIALFLFAYNTTLRAETTAPVIFMLLSYPEIVKNTYRRNIRMEIEDDT